MLHNLTQQQLQSLMKLVSMEPTQRMMGMFPLSGILDIGATNHVTGNEQCLYDLSDTMCPIGLSDGQQVVATEKGKVKLDDQLIFENVYFVPKLCCSLQSVSQVIDDTHCRVSFTNQMCYVQEQQQ